MKNIEYPTAWNCLESPSQRYELLLTLDDVLASTQEWATTVREFLLDDLSANDRVEGIVGGCLLNLEEERLFFAFLAEYEAALAQGFPTEQVKIAAAKLKAQMQIAGVPPPSM